MNDPLVSENRNWLWRGLMLVAAVLVGTFVVRYLLIEPNEMAALCERDDAPAWCLLRRFFVFLFVQAVPTETTVTAPVAMGAIVFGVWSTITRSRALAFTALCFGAVGMVLYRFDSVIIGVLLAALVIGREAAGRPEDAERHHA